MAVPTATCSFLPCLESGFSLGCLADVVAGCGAAVLRTRRAAGAGLAGFRRTGWLSGLRADVPESAAHAGGGEPPGRGGPFPGAAQVISQRAGETELGVAGDDQPGPPVSGGGIANLRGGPPENLLEQAKGVFQVKTAQERLP